MNLSIKPLTPELVAAYFDFFDNRAFTDGNIAVGRCNADRKENYLRL